MVFVFLITISQKLETMIRAVKTNLFLLVTITVLSIPLKANDVTPAYIEQYKTIVLNEMDRAKIPASIKMAQAILESASGRSTLARQSNNHFGIKCGKDWNGGAVYHHDDDYKDGLLVRSCFRAYDDAAESFAAHSDFLLRNRRYKFLFELDIYDYKAWANGLRKAGYATDPKYPSKLINLIEKYELYLLDLGVESISDDDFFTQTDVVEPQSTSPGSSKTPRTSSEPIILKPKSANTYAALNYQLEDGYYTFKADDSMEAIAMHFRMDIKELYFRNRLAYGSHPKSGEKIAVRKYIHFKSVPETMPTSVTEEEYLFEETITISSL